MAGQLCTNCHAPLELTGAAPGGIVRCAYCKTDNRALGAGMAHPATPGFGAGPPGFGPPPGGAGFGPPPGGAGFGPPPGAGGLGPPPATPGFGAPPGVIGGTTGLPGSYDANPKGYVAPPPSVVVPSSAGSNAELLGGIGALLAWKSLVFVAGLIVPALCCVSWIVLQVVIGAAGR